MTDNQMEEAKPILMAKKGRKKKYQDYDFQYLLPADIESLIEGYLTENKHFNTILTIVKKINDFFVERTSMKPADYSLFKDLWMSSIDRYIKYEEISFYFYIKRCIEQYYGLRNKRLYFADEQEQAFIKFLAEDDEIRKNILYKKFLKQALEKMVESQIHRYKLHSSTVSYEDQLNSTVSFLHEKMKHFNEKLGAKAYSYLGTISVRHLRNAQKKEYEHKTSTLNYSDFYQEFESSPEHIYFHKPYEDNLNVEFFYEIPDLLYVYMHDPDKRKLLTDVDIKVGESIIYLIRNWDEIFDLKVETSNKFKKNSIFELLRNLSGYPTKHITISLKTFRAIYFKEKGIKIEDGYNALEDLM